MHLARWIRTSSLFLLIPLLAPAAQAQWVEFSDETASRLSAASELVENDNQEKDYAWGDVDRDGDIDLVIARKQPFTSPGKQANVLLLNDDGVLTDYTSSFVTASSVPGDDGFLTPTNDRDILLVDLDLDDWLDVVTATTLSDGDPKHIGHPRIYMNLGCGAQGTTATSCTTAEWNGFYYDEPRVPQMLSYSDQSGFNPRFSAVSAGDVTGDGYPELYFSDHDGSGAGGSGQPTGADYNDRLLINRGLLAPAVFDDGTQDPGRFEGDVPGVGQSFEVSTFSAANAISDLNNDGFNDIVKQSALSLPLWVGIAWNDSTPSLGFFDSYDVPYSQAPFFVSVGNLNNDDSLDLVISDDGSDRYLLNQANGPRPTFIPYQFAYTNGAGDDGFGSNNLIVDLDRDGWNDVLIADVETDIPGCSRRLHIYRNEGGIYDAQPGDIVTLREQTTGTDCQPFLGNPSTCVVASISSNLLEGVHDVAVFDLNGDTFDDMILGRCGSTEIYMQVPNGLPAGGIRQYDPSDQLIIGKDGTNLDLSWGASCVETDSDYAVYEGRLLVPFTSHGIDTCTTGGATSTTVSPSILSSYYLVVPHNGASEGSYGENSAGAPRTQGVVSCFDSIVAECGP